MPIPWLIHTRHTTKPSSDCPTEDCKHAICDDGYDDYCNSKKRDPPQIVCILFSLVYSCCHWTGTRFQTSGCCWHHWQIRWSRFVEIYNAQHHVRKRWMTYDINSDARIDSTCRPFGSNWLEYAPKSIRSSYVTVTKDIAVHYWHWPVQCGEKVQRMRSSSSVCCW